MVRRGDNILFPKMIRKQRGFALFEICIAIIISAIIFASAMALYKVYQKSHYFDVVAQRQADVRNALAYFFYLQGRLPCVADPSLPETDPNYGTEVDCTGVTPLPANVVRTNVNSVRGAALANPYVWIGAVPARTLGLPDSDMAEPTGHLFIYAVTESMASVNPGPPPTPDLTQGAIDVRNPSTGASLLSSTPFGAGSAIYVVISPGTDGKGAWTTNGSPGSIAAQKASCLAGPSEEQGNCDGDTIFNSGDSNTYNSAASPAHYEDMTLYSTTINPNAPPACPTGTAMYFNGTAWSCTDNLQITCGAGTFLSSEDPPTCLPLPAFTCSAGQHVYGFDGAGGVLCN